MAELNRDNLGFLLAKASQRWNELLHERFVAAGFAEVRPAYGSILVPLFEEDGLRLGVLARRARLSKQTMTTLIRVTEEAGLVRRAPDPTDRRASLIPGPCTIVNVNKLELPGSSTTRVGKRASSSSFGPASMSITPVDRSAWMRKKSSPRPFTTLVPPSTTLSSRANSVAQPGRLRTSAR